MVVLSCGDYRSVPETDEEPSERRYCRSHLSVVGVRAGYETSRFYNFAHLFRGLALAGRSLEIVEDGAGGGVFAAMIREMTEEPQRKNTEVFK